MADIAEWEKAYAAGLFDGEGCVQLYMRQSGMKPNGQKDRALRTALSVAGVDVRPLTWLKERYGGGLRTTKDRSRERQPLWIWVVTSRGADDFARDIYPYLLVKKEQVELWIEARGMMYARGYAGDGLPEDEVAKRRELVARVKELKRVGPPRGELSSQT